MQLKIREGLNKEKFEKDEKIVYLREGTYNSFEIHPKSFSNRIKILLKRLAKNEGIKL